MPWVRARRAYICYRCKERIKRGERYFIHSGGKEPGGEKDYPSYRRTYRYHRICKSLSGRKEAWMTGNLKAFLKAVKEGPKLTEEIPVNPALVNSCYRKAVMMGLPVYKHIFYSHRTKEVIFFMQKHEKECLRRVKRLGKSDHNFHYHHRSIIGSKGTAPSKRS